MPIEAELKAVVLDPENVRKALQARASGESSVYRDTYYDLPARVLESERRELRIRSVDSAGQVRHVLTYKAPTVDAASGSKPEFETEVVDRSATESILAGLGYEVTIAFEKHCENFSFSVDRRDVLATLVRIPEVEGSGTFLEIETVTEEADLHSALSVLSAILLDLGVGPEDRTTDLYTDLVANHRSDR